MERVTEKTMVSGGSLIVAAIMATCEMSWPSSALYLERVYPTLKRLLTTRDLFSLEGPRHRGYDPSKYPAAQ